MKIFYGRRKLRIAPANAMWVQLHLNQCVFSSTALSHINYGRRKTQCGYTALVVEFPFLVPRQGQLQFDSCIGCGQTIVLFALSSRSVHNVSVSAYKCDVTLFRRRSFLQINHFSFNLY